MEILKILFAHYNVLTYIFEDRNEREQIFSST